VVAAGPDRTLSLLERGSLLVAMELIRLARQSWQQLKITTINLSMCPLYKQMLELP